MGTMKRKQTETTAPAYTSLVASAARVDTKMGVQSISGRDKEWQETAYRMYDDVGEFRYACDWVGSMMSKALLFPTYKREGVVEPVLEGPAKDFVDSLFNDDDGKAEMLRLIGVHMTIAGECYLVGYDNPDPYGDEDYVWHVASPTSINRIGGSTGKWQINNEVIDVEPNDVLVIRVWRAHPKDNRFAVAPSKALLPVLGEILRLTQHVAAQVDSRLAGAGILLMPNEMTFPPPPESLGENGQAIQHHANDAESLMNTITEAMSTSIQNRASASALVPIVITAPSDAIGAVKHMTFWSELDRQAIELRTEAIRRLALGMDMPPEVLQGNTEANHWSAWQADESAIKAHTEPLLKIITSAISQGYLRPLLKGADVDWSELRKYSIGADTSEMRLRPNRSKEALELYDRGIVSEETLRRETGFAAEDGMSGEERREWFRNRVASGSTTPELVEGALRSLGVFEGETGEDAGSTTNTTTTSTGETQEARPTPTLKNHPERALPDEERNNQIRESRRRKATNTLALTAAAEQVAIRAFERAGNKLKNKMQAKPRVPAAELYPFVNISPQDTEFLLEDAWAHLPRVAERFSVDENLLRDAVEEYTKHSLVAAVPHSYERFETYLSNYFAEHEEQEEMESAQ